MTSASPLAIARQARRRCDERRPECQATGAAAEARLEALQERLGQRDLWEQDERLPPGAEAAAIASK